MTVLLLLGAAACLTLGHICKAKRWQLFVSVYENVPDARLIGSLAAGYLINFYLPFHVGDLFRSWYAGRKMHNGVGYALATVIVDRVLDILSVALIFAAAAVLSPSAELKEAAAVYLIMVAAVAVLLIPVICFNRQIKQTALYLCSIFNEKIKFRLLFFLWSLISSFKDVFRKVHKAKLLLYTAAMWAGYLASYTLVSAMLTGLGNSASLADILVLMFRAESIVHSTFAATSSVFSTTSEVLLSVYVLAPLPLLIAGAALASRRHAKSAAPESPLLLLPQFKPDEQLHFLQNYFEGRDRKSFHEYISMNNDVSILRDYSAGSDATTMLCVRENGAVFRKYAFGSAVEKLEEQARWIKDRSGALPLPVISLEKKGTNSYCYDMRYDHEGINMFQYIYSHPIEESRKILESILSDLRRTLHISQGPVDSAGLDRYIDEKVTANLDLICQSRLLRGLTESGTITINGLECRNLPQLRFMLEKDHLRRIFSSDTASAVHGDLTLENVICYSSGDHERSYYLIDPNPGNPVCTPALDYGKLLQSLHGKYELLGQRRAHVSGSSIDFLLPDPVQYRSIYGFFKDWMAENLTAEEIRSVYYHEIIHWLRLMPYRLRRNEATANQYYAALILVMNDVYDLFEEKEQ